MFVYQFSFTKKGVDQVSSSEMKIFGDIEVEIKRERLFCGRSYAKDYSYVFIKKYKGTSDRMVIPTSDILKVEGADSSRIQFSEDFTSAVVLRAVDFGTSPIVFSCCGIKPIAAFENVSTLALDGPTNKAFQLWNLCQNWKCYGDRVFELELRKSRSIELVHHVNVYQGKHPFIIKGEAVTSIEAGNREVGGNMFFFFPNFVFSSRLSKVAKRALFAPYLAGWYKGHESESIYAANMKSAASDVAIAAYDAGDTAMLKILTEQYRLSLNAYDYLTEKAKDDAELLSIVLNGRAKYIDQERIDKSRATHEANLLLDEYMAENMKAYWRWSRVGNGVTLSEYLYPEGENAKEVTVVVPPRIGKYPVISIGKQAFRSYRCMRLHVVLNHNVYLCDGAFESSPLVSIKLHEDMSDIAASCFDGSHLESIVLPPKLKRIGRCAFAGCNISEIKIPDQVENIPDYCFTGCRNLRKVDLPAGLEKIGSYAFQYCDGLFELRIPRGALLGEWALSGSSIALVDFKEPRDIRMGVLSGSKVASVVIPNGTRVIERQAFSETKKLSHVTIPSSVEVIMHSAFYSSSIESVESNAQYIEEGAFKYCNQLKEVFLEKINSIEQDSFAGCSALRKAALPSVTVIADGAFGCSNLRELYLGKTPVFVSRGAFSNIKTKDDDPLYIRVGAEVDVEKMMVVMKDALREQHYRIVRDEGPQQLYFC